MINNQTEYNKEFINEFIEVYSSIISDMCNYHTFHDDGNCFWFNMAERIVTSNYKYFTYIYQPTYDDWEGDVNEANFIILIKNYKVSKEDKKQIIIEKEKIEKIFIDDFKEIMKITENKWFHEINTFCFNDIMQIIKPFELIQNNKYKIKYKPFNAFNDNLIGGFIPINIQKIASYKNDINEKNIFEYNQRLKDYTFSFTINK